jgi:hypothetical protein
VKAVEMSAPDLQMSPVVGCIECFSHETKHKKLMQRLFPGGGQYREIPSYRGRFAKAKSLKAKDKNYLGVKMQLCGA